MVLGQRDGPFIRFHSHLYCADSSSRLDKMAEDFWIQICGIEGLGATAPVVQALAQGLLSLSLPPSLSLSILCPFQCSLSSSVPLTFCSAPGSLSFLFFTFIIHTSKENTLYLHFSHLEGASEDSSQLEPARRMSAAGQGAVPARGCAIHGSLCRRAKLA